MNPLSLRGHHTVLRRLTDALERDRLPHALLFAGPAGIGKSRAALALAASIACSAAASRPCGDCAACRQVAAGTHPDLLRIGLPAGKKEIGIDLIRQLKRFASLQTVSAPRKMAIADDAERLSIAAQNAFLKTLEEPPGQALIILVTASPGALLATVRSRCQRVVFQPLSEEDVRAVLLDCGIPAEQADQLAAEADGSPGQALLRRTIWQESDREALLGLLADLNPARYGSVVAMSKGLGRTEQEMAVRLERMLAWYRDAAVRMVGGGAPEASGGGATVFDSETTARCADAVAEALRTLRRRNPNRLLLAEALALRLARC